MRTYRLIDVAVPSDQRMKVKQSKSRDKYKGLARELKKLSNIKPSAKQIVIGALETVPKWLKRGLEEIKIGGRIATI